MNSIVCLWKPRWNFVFGIAFAAMSLGQTSSAVAAPDWLEVTQLCARNLDDSAAEVDFVATRRDGSETTESYSLAARGYECHALEVPTELDRNSILCSTSGSAARCSLQANDIE